MSQQKVNQEELKIKCSRCGKADEEYYEIQDTAFIKAGKPEGGKLKLCSKCGKELKNWLANIKK